jgi:hypothetical protein
LRANCEAVRELGLCCLRVAHDRQAHDSDEADANPGSPEARPGSPEARPGSPEAKLVLPEAKPVLPEARPTSLEVLVHPPVIACCFVTGSSAVGATSPPLELAV